MRLARFLATAGVGSRRQCEQHVRDGRVSVNGHRLDSPASNVVPGTDAVCFDGHRVRLPSPKYIMLHKPRGVTCSAKDAHADQLVVDLIPKSQGRLFTVGRLDRESEGLLLLTNDGDWAERLTHPRFAISKTYKVWCHGAIGAAFLRTLRRGIKDDGDHLQPVRVRELKPDFGCRVLEFVLTEGKKREVRRLCAAVDLTVKRLLRTSLGGLSLDLAPGRWRHLSRDEVTAVVESGGMKEG